MPAIAALLHDAAEDHGGEARVADIRARFGGDVAAIVEACSDSLTEDPDAPDAAGLEEEWQSSLRTEQELLLA